MNITSLKWWFNNYKKPLFCALLCSLVCIFTLALYQMRSAPFGELVLDLEVTSDDVGQLFYSTDGRYSEESSTRFDIYTGRHKYKIPFKHANYLRLDPGSLPFGEVKLYSLSILSGDVTHVFFVNELKNIIRPVKSMMMQTPTLDAVVLSIQGEDPYLEIKTSVLFGEYLTEYHVWLTTFVLIFAFFGAGICLIKKYREGQGWLFPGYKEYLFYVLILFFICNMISAMTPSHQSPDEFAHIDRAYYLSQGQWNLEVQDGVVGGYVDPQLWQYQESFRNIIWKKDRKITAENMQRAESLSWSQNRHFQHHEETAPYMFAIYIPQALAFKLGQELNISIHESYLMARFFNLLAVCLLILVAFSMVPPNMMLLSILFLPMMLFQFSSATVDAVSVALSLLVCSVFVRASEKPGQVPLLIMVLMNVAIVVIVTSRMYMLPIMLLPVLLAIRSKKKVDFLMLVISFLLVFLWITQGWVHSPGIESRVGLSRGEVAVYYLINPADFIHVMTNTFSTFGSFYLSSFIGNLGWLDTKFDDYFYKVSACFLLLASLLSISWRDIKRQKMVSASLIFVACASVALIFIALLTGWTKHPAVLIDGVQGRYFTIPLLLLAYSLSGPTKSPFNEKIVISHLLLIIWVAFMSYSTINLLLVRFYLA